LARYKLKYNQITRQLNHRYETNNEWIISCLSTFCLLDVYLQIKEILISTVGVFCCCVCVNLGLVARF